MRRLLVIILVLCVLLFIASLFIKPIVLMVAQKQLENYDIEVKGLDMQYELVQLLKSGALQVTFKNVKGYGAEAEDGILRIGLGSGVGDFKIARLKYDKLIVTQILGDVKLKGAQVALANVSALALDGTIHGDANLVIGKETQYLVNLKCADLDIDRVVRDFDLAAKFNMTGRLGGQATLKGAAGRIQIMDGMFSTLSPGGILTIHDTESLARMAANTRQPVDLLVESFKNYQYNTGSINLGFEQGNAILQVGLDGKTGKRNLNVVLHDFKLLMEDR